MNGQHKAIAAGAAVVFIAVLVVTEGMSGGGGWERRQKVLKQIPDDPDILINITYGDLPATSDMVQLGKRATPAIANCLINNMEPGIRASCAEVLTATRDARAIDPLMDALDDPSGRVVSMALQSLSAVETRKPTKRLLKMMKRPNVPSYLRNEAVLALGRMGDPKAIDPLMDYFEDTWDPAAQKALWDMRHRLDEDNFETLFVDPLEEDDEDNLPPQEVIAFAVERSGDLRLEDAVDPLMEHYEQHPYLQNRIIYNLGRIGDDDAVEFLEGLLDMTAEARLLNNVTFALQRLKQDVVPFLRKALNDRRAYIRFNAAFVAGDLGERALVPELIKALSDPNDIVRSEAAVALGSIGDAGAIPALEATTKVKNPVVRRDAVLALARIDYKGNRERILTELLTSKQTGVRNKAIGVLGYMKDKAAIPTVIRRLNPDYYGDQSLGLAFLAQFDKVEDPDALAFLMRVAAGNGERQQALVLLARFADERTRFMLRAWLHQDSGQASQLMRALARMEDKESVALARKWFEQTGAPQAQLYAGFLLAATGDKAGADLLLDALENGPVERKRVAAMILTQFDISRFDTRDRLLAMLEHPDVYVRLYAARPLAHHGEQKAVVRLRKELDKRTPFIRDEVLDIVERLPPSRREKIVKEWSNKAKRLRRKELERLL